MVSKDIETKRLIFDNDLDKDYTKARKALFNGDNSLMDDFWCCFGDDVTRVCRNVDKSRRDKAKRCRERVENSVTCGNAFFITLTFKDDILLNTTEKTRRTYVSRAFKAIGYRYVANIDYGDKTHREHYHGIIEPLPSCLASWKNGKREYKDVPDFREWCNRYGFVTIERIGDTEKDAKKVAKYTAKLSAHALKKSTRERRSAPRLIYSRKPKRTMS